MKPATPRLFTAAARRRLIATIAGAATAFALMTAAAAVPARADTDRDDLARALAAIAAVAIIAGAVKEDDRRRPQPDIVHGPGWNPHGHGWGHDRHDRHDRRARVLPADCRIEFPGHRGPRTYYGERCLRRAGVEGRLPRACADQARIRNRVVQVYAERCLVEAGFRPEGHRRGPGSGDRW